MKYFTHILSVALLALSALQHSPATAYAAVLCLTVALIEMAVREKLMAMKNIKIEVPDELRRTIQDLNARVATIEHNARVRGF